LAQGKTAGKVAKYETLGAHWLLARLREKQGEEKLNR
jgi:hypothetical protein